MPGNALHAAPLLPATQAVQEAAHAPACGESKPPAPEASWRCLTAATAVPAAAVEGGPSNATMGSRATGSRGISGTTPPASSAPAIGVPMGVAATGEPPDVRDEGDGNEAASAEPSAVVLPVLAKFALPLPPPLTANTGARQPGVVNRGCLQAPWLEAAAAAAVAIAAPQAAIGSGRCGGIVRGGTTGEAIQAPLDP
mmetsp:Transcript_122372/g.341416  ORF Transcript_122372/g.341416 Transcript_122372/m.341416 type:complete len:197 (-) Transcript_122372:485-1075(-)